MKIIFFEENFSLKKKALNRMVDKGAAKNKRLEIIGLVCFNPKKLNKIAKKTTKLMTTILLKQTFISVLNKPPFLFLRVKTKPTKKTIDS